MEELTRVDYWEVTGARVLGAAHRRQGKPCQDAIALERTNLGLCLAIADGHGSERSPLSDIGSWLAVQTAVRILIKLAENSEHETLSAVKQYVHEQLPRQLVLGWTDAVLNEPQEGRGGPWPDLDAQLRAYGSTLLAVLITERYMLYLQLGDGDILVVDSAGQVSRPIRANPAHFANETSSLSQPSAWTLMEIVFQPLALPEQEPALILLATDGYANSYVSNADFERIGGDLQRRIASRPEGWQELVEQLPRWLEATTEQGSGDDIAVGLLWNTGPAQALPQPDHEREAIDDSSAGADRDGGD